MSSFKSLHGALLAASLSTFAMFSAPALADASYQALPFAQNWSNTGLITVNDDWSGVPGVVGFRGDDLTAATGTDPQTIVGEGTPVVDVNANQTNPATFFTGGPAEFEITDPAVALAGSGTADAPYLQFHLNTTAQTGVTVAYALRDLDGSTDDSIQQVALQYRVGAIGDFTNVPGGYVADASSGPSLATLVTPVCAVLPTAVENQAEVQVRVITTNAFGNDEFIGVDNIVVSTAGCPAPPLTLSVNDVAVTEGDTGTVTASFTVGLSAPAGAGGVTFDIATADGTATAASADYVARSLTGQTIAAGASSYAFDVTVNGDTAIEPNETFFVNVTNVTGATVADGQGQGTISNDDATLIAINQIQGPGASSPLVGAMVTTRGIVTGRKNNGFFIQAPDASVDADPLTSEGIFVFTSAPPAPGIVVGTLAQVSGTVVEFIPSQDMLQPPLTELSNATTVVLSNGNPLPTAIPLSTTFPDPTGPFDQLERVEGMRVSAASLTVNGATLGSVNETSATATSNGIFHARVTGLPRTFREPGIEAPNPAPGGTIPPIPRWDSNPELIAVDSDAQFGAAINVNAGAVVTNVSGPLDYTFRRYTIVRDDVASPFTGGQVATAVTQPTASDITIASYNLERFFDDVNDPMIGEPVLTPAALQTRLNKASLGIRDFLRTPDILGVVEVENLTVLQSLATRINGDAVAALQPNPVYVAYLVEGNDVGGIDVGFLVKTGTVGSGVPRVLVNTVVQENDGELLVNPDATTSILNDRPPLRLDAVINYPGGATFPVTVIVNHLRSLNDVENPEPGSNGWATTGARVRAKRQAQAESLANLVQDRQTANPNERIVVIGDFNAFEFNDGLGDSMGVIDGTPSPDDQTAVPGDGIDLVNPDQTILLEADPAQRYSFVFGGNAQSLDHVLINGAMAAALGAQRTEHPRINADFNALERNSATTATRLSDHDPLVGFFRPSAMVVPELIFANGFEE